MAVLEAKLVACLICTRSGVYELVLEMWASRWLWTRRAHATLAGCARTIDEAEGHVVDGVYPELTMRAQVFGDRGLRANGTRRSIVTFSIVCLSSVFRNSTWPCCLPSVVKAPQHEVNFKTISLAQSLNRQTTFRGRFNNVFIPCNQCIACCHLQL